jgi:single-strand DNA-binding protein
MDEAGKDKESEMANFNKVILLGNLTRDPQLSYLPTNQTPVVDFGMAMNRKWTGQDGSQREETCFVDCRCFGRQAETINKYCSKGSPLLVEGRLTFDTWQAQDGSKRSKHRVTVMNFQFIGGGQRAGGGGQEGYGGQQAGGGGQGGYGGPAPAGQAGPEMGGEQPPSGGPGDDVPF